VVTALVIRPWLDSASMLGCTSCCSATYADSPINLESDAQAQAETGMDEQAWTETQIETFTALTASGRYPTFAKMLRDLESGYDFDLDATFELGLGPLLDDFGRWIDRNAPQ